MQRRMQISPSTRAPRSAVGSATARPRGFCHGNSRATARSRVTGFSKTSPGSIGRRSPCGLQAPRQERRGAGADARPERGRSPRRRRRGPRRPDGSRTRSPRIWTASRPSSWSGRSSGRTARIRSWRVSQGARGASSTSSAEAAGKRPDSFWARVERAIERSATEWTFLRPTGFAANTLMWANQIRERGFVRWPYGARPARSSTSATSPTSPSSRSPKTVIPAPATS